MAILIMCSNSDCGELFDVPDEAVGTEVRCPSCGAVQTIKVDDLQQASVRDAKTQTPTNELVAMPPEIPANSEEDEIDLKPILPIEEDIEAPQAASLRSSPEHQPRNSSPSQQIKFIEELDDELPDFSDLSAIQGSPLKTASDRVLEDTQAIPIILVLGLIGMILGVFIGVTCFPTKMLGAVYIGGLIGWICGFIFGLLLAHIAERNEPSKVRCRICYNVFPEGTINCQWCGAAIKEQNINPLAADCLRAMSYARSSGTSVYWMAMSLMAGYAIYAASRHALEGLQQWQWAMWTLCALTGFFIFTFWLRYFLAVIYQTLKNRDTPPKTPNPFSLSGLGTGLKGLFLLAMYLVPILTIPLLPLGILFLGAPSTTVGAFNIKDVCRSAWQHARDFVILWLLLLLWFTGLCLSLAILVCLLRGGGKWIPDLEGFSGILLREILRSMAMAMVGATAAIFGVVLSRCIALFGRYNYRHYYPVKPEKYRP